MDLQTNTKQFKSQLSGIGNLCKKIAGPIAAAFSVAAITKFGKACIDLASDLAEVQNVVDVTFPTMSAQANKFAKSAADSFGLSETMAKRYLGTFGSMAEAFGFTEKEALKMSETLTGLSGDVASFYNITQDEAYTKLKSVFSGETETLKDLGIVMTQSALDQYALAHGVGATTKEMSEQEKVSLRLAFVTDQLTNAAGDFARTSDSWANQTRILKLRFDSLRAAIGQGLIALLKPVVKWLNAILLGLTTVANKFAEFISMITGKEIGGSSGAAQIAEDMGTAADAAGGLGNAADHAASGVGKTANNTKKAAKAAKELKRTLAGFDKMNILSRQEDSKDKGKSSGGANLSGLKAGGGGYASGMASATNKEIGKIKVPKGLSKGLEALKKSFKELGKAFSEAWGAIKKAASWLWKNILKPFFEWFVGKVLPVLVSIFAQIVKIVTSVGRIIGKVFVKVWNAYLKPLAEKIGPIIVKVITWIRDKLAIFAKWLREHEDVIADKIFTVIKGIATAVKAVVKIFTSIGNIVGKVVAKIWETWLKPLLKKLAPYIVKLLGLIKKGLTWIRDRLAKAAKWLGGHEDEIADKIFAVIKGIVKVITTIVKVIIKVVKAAIKVIAAIIKGIITVIKAIITVIKGIIKVVATVIKTVVKIIKGIITVIKTIVKFIKALATGVKNAKETFTKFGNLLKNAFQGAVEKAKEIIEKFAEVWNGIKDKAVELVAEAKEKVEGALEKLKEGWDAIKDKAAELKAEIKQKWEDLKAKWSALTDNIADKAAEFKGKISQTWNDLKAKWAALADNVADKVADFKAKVATAWSSLKSKWEDLTDNIADKVADFKAKVATAWRNLKSKWEDLTDNIADKVADFKAEVATEWKDLKKKWKEIYDNFKGKTATFFAKWKNTVSDAWKKFKSGDAFKNFKGRTATYFAKWKNTVTDAWKKFKSSDTYKKFTGKVAEFKATFKDLFSGALKSAWNGLIKVLNKVIDGINWLLPKKKELKHVPYMAEGGFVKKNTPQLAVIGDNRHQGEYVAPEDKLMAMARQAAAMSNGGGHDAEIIALLTQIMELLRSKDTDVYIDGQKITNRIVQILNANTRATGRSAIIY